MGIKKEAEVTVKLDLVKGSLAVAVSGRSEVWCIDGVPTGQGEAALVAALHTQNAPGAHPQHRSNQRRFRPLLRYAYVISVLTWFAAFLSLCVLCMPASASSTFVLPPYACRPAQRRNHQGKLFLANDNFEAATTCFMLILTNAKRLEQGCVSNQFPIKLSRSVCLSV